MWKNVVFPAAVSMITAFSLASLFFAKVNLGIGFAEFVSITLAAVTTILAVLGLMIAYFAFIGKQEIEQRAYEIAAKKAEEKVKEIIESKTGFENIIGSVSDQLRQHLASKVMEEGDKLYYDYALSGMKWLSVPEDAKEDTPEEDADG